jgi:tetratricopeptide (TPR) repeat protein
MSGGVRLMAIALRVTSGDVSALSDAVHVARQGSKLAWRFTIDDWAIAHAGGLEIWSEAAALFAHGDFLEGQGHLNEARALYTQIVNLDSAFWLAQLRRAEVSIMLTDNPEGALVDANAVLTKVECASGYNVKGAALIALGRTAEAIAAFERAIALCPDAGAAYYNLTRARLLEGSCDDALVSCMLARDRLSKSAKVMGLLGDVKECLGDHVGAATAFGEAIQCEPRSPRWYDRRGQAWVDAGEYNRGILEHSRAIALQPDVPEYYMNRAIAYEMKSLHGLAEQDLNAAIRMKPDYYEALYNRGTLKLQRNDLDSAIRDFDAALEIRPSLWQALNNRGIAWVRMGNHERARQDLGRCRAVGGLPSNALLDAVQRQEAAEGSMAK